MLHLHPLAWCFRIEHERQAALLESSRVAARIGSASALHTLLVADAQRRVAYLCAPPKAPPP